MGRVAMMPAQLYTCRFHSRLARALDYSGADKRRYSRAEVMRRLNHFFANRVAGYRRRADFSSEKAFQFTAKVYASEKRQ